MRLKENEERFLSHYSQLSKVWNERGDRPLQTWIVGKYIQVLDLECRNHRFKRILIVLQHRIRLFLAKMCMIRFTSDTKAVSKLKEDVAKQTYQIVESHVARNSLYKLDYVKINEILRFCGVTLLDVPSEPGSNSCSKEALQIVEEERRRFDEVAKLLEMSSELRAELRQSSSGRKVILQTGEVIGRVSSSSKQLFETAKKRDHLVKNLETRCDTLQVCLEKLPSHIKVITKELTRLEACQDQTKEQEELLKKKLVEIQSKFEKSSKAATDWKLELASASKTLDSIKSSYVPHAQLVSTLVKELQEMSKTVGGKQFTDKNGTIQVNA